MHINSIENSKNNKIVLFSNNHENHIKTALKIFYDNKLYGVGVKQFRVVCSDQTRE